MFYRILHVLGLLAAAALWAGFGWQVFGRDHVIPYDPPQRCLHVAAPLLPGHTLTQTFHGRARGLRGVSLAFRTTAAAQVAVHVHEVAADGLAAPLAAATIALPANHPFYTVNVVFPTQTASAGKDYAVVLRAGGDDEGNGGRDAAPLVWSCWGDWFAFGALLIDDEAAHGDLLLQPLYQRGAGGAVQAIVGRFQAIRIGVLPAWLWWLCLAFVLFAMPTLVVWAAGGRVGSLANLIAVLILLPLVGLGVYWGDPRLHRPVITAGADPVVAAAAAPPAVDLLHELRKQTVGEIAPQQTWDRQLTFALEPVTLDNGERRLALRTSVNTAVTWHNLTIPTDAAFTFSAAVDRDQWTPADGPIHLRITVTADGATLADVQETLIDAQGGIDPILHSLNLAAHAGKELTIMLATQGETQNSARMVVWHDLRLAAAH